MIAGRPSLVLLGMMTKIPVAGVVWQVLHYLVGFERLGYETYYVEAHARTPSMLMDRADDDSSGRAAAFIAGVLERFGFGRRWAYHALHSDGHVYGLSEGELRDLYDSAALIINLHGGTQPRQEHIATDRLVYLETDPVDVEVQLGEGRKETVEYLRPHCAFFTFGENYGKPDCLLPISKEFALRATRQPVVLDFWKDRAATSGGNYTTIGSWRQQWRDVQLRGQRYGWSKHQEFAKVLDLPARAAHSFELALAGCPSDDRTMLEGHGWRVRDAVTLSQNIDIYRHYITGSHAEFTVAKDQNVRLRTGWFSDRSATYLAAGRPVITQDTGFGNILPTGEGLFAFATLDDALAAVEAIESDYGKHSRAATEIAQEYFAATRVLGRLIEEVGLPRVPPGLVIAPASRRPIRLEEETIQTVRDAPMPVAVGRPTADAEVTAVVVAFGGLAFTRMCVESVLGSLNAPALEVVVVDNGSESGTAEYLRQLSDRDRRLRVIAQASNRGFAAGANAGLEAARGRILLLLNNDTILPPESLGRLVRYLHDETIGLVGPVSNRAATEAEVDMTYTTYGELMAASAGRAASHARHTMDLDVLTLYCAATRRDVYRRLGPLDEQFELGMFEDDDYSRRVRGAGYRVVCAEDVYVHHFGEGAFGHMFRTGEHARVFSSNRSRYEDKWGIEWRPHVRRHADRYLESVDRVRETVRAVVPPGSTVLVVSKGDDELLRFDERIGAHFPQVDGGTYSGHHPADSSEAIEELESMRRTGAEFLVFPVAAMWWLDYYADFRTYLDTRYKRVCQSDDCVIYELVAASPA